MLSSKFKNTSAATDQIRTLPSQSSVSIIKTENKLEHCGALNKPVSKNVEAP